MSLRPRGNKVELAGIFYHMGENDMSFHPYRRQAAERLQAIIAKSRADLGKPGLQWYVSQQSPTDDKRVNNVDVVAEVSAAAAADPHLMHIKAFDLPPQEKKLVITTEGNTSSSGNLSPGLTLPGTEAPYTIALRYSRSKATSMPSRLE